MRMQTEAMTILLSSSPENVGAIKTPRPEIYQGF